MNYFDLLVLIIATGLTIAGFFEGLVRGAVKLAGLIVLLMGLAMFSGRISDAARAVGILPPSVMVPLAFVVIFIAGGTVLNVAALFLHRLVHTTPAAFLDSGLGAVLGLAKALLLCGLVGLVLSHAPRDSFVSRQIAGSRTGAPLIVLVYQTVPFVKSRVRPLLERIMPAAPAPPAEREEPDQEQRKRHDRHPPETII